MKEKGIWIKFKKYNKMVQRLSVRCYGLKLKVLSNRTTLVLSNTRELDRVLCTKWSTLYTTTHGPCFLLCTLP